MRTCDQIERLIYPYLDGELDYSQNIVVEEHLLQCQNCCDLLNEKKRFLTILQNAPLKEEVPVALQNKVLLSLKKEGKKHCFNLPFSQNLSIPMTSGLTLAAVAMVFLFVSFFSQKQAIPPFVNTSIAQHQNFLKGASPLELKSSNPHTVNDWLQQRVTFAPKLPNFDDINIILQGSSVLNLEGRLVGLISYRVHDIPVSLLMVKSSPETAIENSNHAYAGSRRISFSQSQGYNAVSWSVKSTNFSLVSTLPHKGKEGCMVCHANGSGLIDLSDFYANDT